jgi:hypothetical protein
LRGARSTQQYYLDQLRDNRNDPRVSAHIEYKKWKWGTIRLDVTDAIEGLQERNRTFYLGTRASGTVTRVIERDRRFDRVFELSLSGRF